MCVHFKILTAYWNCERFIEKPDYAECANL
jgi:hypothetical protein